MILIRGKKSRESAYYILDRLFATLPYGEAVSVIKDILVTDVFFEKKMGPKRRREMLRKLVKDYHIVDENGVLLKLEEDVR